MGLIQLNLDNLNTGAARSLFRQAASTEEGQTVQLNKGHFSLDTEERLSQFSEKLSYGWEEEYTEYRKQWTELPAQHIVRNYPLLVDLELASLCNLKCPMCYTITDEFKSKVTKGFMDFDLFQRIVDEVAGKIYALRVSFRGESLLHKQFAEFVTYAKKSGIQEVSTLTNGAKLNGETLKAVLESGIDWITISIDGTGETYEKIRKPTKFERIISNLTEIREYKLKNGLVKPVIKVQGIWPAIREDPELYYNTLAPLTDLVAFNPLIDYLRRDSEIVYETDFSCPQLYQRLVVGSDGKVMMCSNDEDGKALVGDANQQTIHEIWHSPQLNMMRQIHERPEGFKEIESCRECYYPRKTQVNETATVNGRTIYVENYMNRLQTVGT